MEINIFEHNGSSCEKRTMAGDNILMWLNTGELRKPLVSLYWYSPTNSFFGQDQIRNSA